jgi:hypothetical protein
VNDYDRQEDKFPSRDSRVWQDSLEKVITVTASYTVSAEDDYILVNTTTGVITITLPNSITKKKIVIIRIAGSNNVTISPVGTDTVDGTSSKTISSSYSPIRLKGILGGFISI